MSDQSELAELRQRVSALEQRVAEVCRPAQPTVAAPSRESESQGVRIYHPADVPAIEMPSDEQLRRLAEVVLAKYPKLGPDLSNPRWADMNRDEWDFGFRASFRRIASLNRTDEFDIKRGIRYFVDEAEEWLRLQGMQTDLRWPAYLCALIAQGDISFSIEGPYVGLRLDGLGRSPLPAWRAVLDGRMRAPSPPPAR